MFMRQGKLGHTDCRAEVDLKLSVWLKFSCCSWPAPLCVLRHRWGAEVWVWQGKAVLCFQSGSAVCHLAWAQGCSALTKDLFSCRPRISGPHKAGLLMTLTMVSDSFVFRRGNSGTSVCVGSPALCLLFVFSCCLSAWCDQPLCLFYLVNDSEWCWAEGMLWMCALRVPLM